MGKVVGLYPLLPNRMSVDRDENGELVYTYTSMWDSKKGNRQIRLNRENNLIRMRMQVETAGLDPVKDAHKIIEIQTKSLNRQLQIQKDRFIP